MKIIQLQASVQYPIRNIMDEVRKIVSNICGGIDDMCLLGDKALVIRAEVYTESLSILCSELTAAGIKIGPQGFPEKENLKAGFEYPLTLQITSFSTSTDGRVSIPSVPG